MSASIPQSLRHALDVTGNVACVLDTDLQIVYCNPAWDQFATLNAGEHAMRDFVIGTNLLKVVPKELRQFYFQMFVGARDTAQVAGLDYECSSPIMYRRFRMEVRPLYVPDLFMVVHSLCFEHNHGPDRPEHPADDQLYLNPGTGLIVNCAHCRRTRRVGEPEVWDWVPAYIGSGAPLQHISHGLCRTCYAYFYPEVYSRSKVRAGTAS
jgi:hypothetical protein